MHISKPKIYLISAFVAIAALFVSKFVYMNVIVPWPYRDELHTCLSEARALQNEAAVAMAEDECFRSFPHFN